MVSALDSGSSVSHLSPGCGHYVAFLGRTHYRNCESSSQMGQKMFKSRLLLLQGGVEMLLIIMVHKVDLSQ